MLQLILFIILVWIFTVVLGYLPAIVSHVLAAVYLLLLVARWLHIATPFS